MIQNEIEKYIALAIKNKGTLTKAINALENEDPITSPRKSLEAQLFDAECNLNTYRAIKTAFMEYTTAKNAKPLDEAAEVNILRAMCKERKDNVEVYTTNNRIELAEKEAAELRIIEALLPATPKDEDVLAAIDAVLAGGIEPVRKNMGLIIKEVKAALPAADGKLISTLVMTKLS